MSKIDVTRTDVVREIEDWQHVVDLMRNTKRDFKRAEVTALPPRVREVGQQFVQAWTIFARESQEEASEVVNNLVETLRDFDAAEHGVASKFKVPIAQYGEPRWTIDPPPQPPAPAIAMPSEPAPSGQVAAPNRFADRLGGGS